MHYFSLFVALCLLALIAPLYVSLNVLASNYLLRNASRLWWVAAAFVREQTRTQLQSVSTTRIWYTVTTHFGSVVALFVMLQQPLNLLALASLLLAYIFITSVLTLSLLAQFPILRSFWTDPIAKLSLLALPAFLLFVAKGYAEVWAGELLGTAAANAGFARLAGAAFLLCLFVATLLAFAAMVSEAALLLVPMAPLKDASRAKRWGLAVLAATSLIATLLGAYAATQLPASRFGNVLLSAIAFEFDASPAGHCELNETERLLASGDDPFVKALHLATSQERALLLQRSPSLFRATRLRDLREPASADRRLYTGRVVECYKPQSSPPTAAALGVAASHVQ